MPQVGPKQAYEHARGLYDRGDYLAAYKVSNQLYTRQPGFPPIVLLHVSVLFRLQRTREGLAIARRALRHITHKPHRVGLLNAITEGLTQSGAFDDAVAMLREEIENQPEVAALIAGLGHVLLLEGKRDETIELVDGARERGLMTLSIAAVYGRAVLRTDKIGRGIELLESVIAQRPEDLDICWHKAYNALGQLYDKTGDYDRAFEAFREANERIPARYDDALTRRRVELALETWTPERIAHAPRPEPPEGAPVPVFVLGMPRSGTTLTEQIIDAHPLGFGAGELGIVPEMYRRLASAERGKPPPGPEGFDAGALRDASRTLRGYLGEMAGDEPVRVIVDKAPMNFWYIGFIATLLPDARIVHCVREPRDNCLSCYFQSLTAGHGYSTDLGACGLHYRRYHEVTAGLVDAVRDPRVGVPVLENRYEDTIADQVSKTHTLLDFVGLEFDNACLNFHESGRIALTLSNDQVRQPIYTSSTKRYERYAHHIGPLEDALGDLIADRANTGARTDQETP